LIYYCSLFGTGSWRLNNFIIQILRCLLGNLAVLTCTVYILTTDYLLGYPTSQEITSIYIGTGVEVHELSEISLQVSNIRISMLFRISFRIHFGCKGRSSGVYVCMYVCIVRIS
jgi:hypothetical protein